MVETDQRTTEISKMDKHLFQIRGVPGAGKTTVASIIHSLDPDSVCMIATDDYWGPDEEFDPDQLEQAHDWCIEQAENAAVDGCNLIIVHNTATEYWEMEAYKNIANRLSYAYHRIVVEDIHGTGSTKEDVDERLRDYMARKFQTRIKTP